MIHNINAYTVTKNKNPSINIYSNNIILDILFKYLDGYYDICKLIIHIKLDLEFEDLKNDWIETNFYNWLTYDMEIRSYLGLIIKKYQNNSINTMNEIIENDTYNGILIMDYFNYYEYYI